MWVLSWLRERKRARGGNGRERKMEREGERDRKEETEAENTQYLRSCRRGLRSEDVFFCFRFLWGFGDNKSMRKKLGST